MTESSPTHVFYGSAKAEQTNIPKNESKIVRGLKKSLEKWFDRVGFKNVEDRFVQAHKNILKTLTNEERAKAYELTGEKWKKTGKILGVTAMVVDAGLAGLGIGITQNWIDNPNIGRKAVSILGDKTDKRRSPMDLEPSNPSMLRALYIKLSDNMFLNGVRPLDLLTEDGSTHPQVLAERNYSSRVGTITALIPGLATLFPIFGVGPAHTMMHLVGMGAEQVGKMKARTNNYVDSGKAAEHAAKVGNAIGKAATETAKYVAEHPDEIRKTVETVNRVKRQNAESAQKLAEAKQKAADIALEKEYQDWIAHHPDKAYYEQSGQPYPSKADYVAKKQEEEAKKQANKEVEKRGLAKDSPKN